jgi:SAM-dependent methyltransferase
VRSISLLLGALAVLTGALVLLFCEKRLNLPTSWAVTATAGAIVAIGLASPLYKSLFEKLIFGDTPRAQVPFAQTIENRNGVINVTAQGAVYGGGVYDGFVRIDPNHDTNFVFRALALSAYSPAPKRMLMIGLSSGSWGQIFVNHPQVQSLDIVEINPGYLELIQRSPVVSSLLSNPKARIYVDDGRRWLIAHPEARYDAIVANTTFHWRDHSATLLSQEFLQLIRKHLNPGGTYYFNTTESPETIATALNVFPYGLRIYNCLVVSDSPIVVSRERWFEHLQHYQINGRLLLDPADPNSNLTLSGYASLAESIRAAPVRIGLETSDSLRVRIGKQRIITDDNMGLEWEPEVDIPWH